MARRRTSDPPYWLVAYEVYCSACNAMHAHAVEARCIACDEPLCLTCRVTRSGEIFCSECSDKEKKRWRHARSGKA